MTLSVIGAGFGRTGTNSLKLALEQLGVGPCHHMLEVFAAPQSASHWQDALDGKYVDWDVALEGFKSQVDWPGAFFWRELSEWSPDAKILLSIREEESWFKSISDTIFALSIDPEKIEDPAAKALALMVNELLDRTIGSQERDHDTVLRAYRRNTEQVTAEVPSDKLLMFDVRQGWQPLCEFLDIPIPDTPFPRVNSTDEFNTRRV